MTDYEKLCWLAGLLEGEGTFLKPPPSSPNKIAIQLEMTDRDVVESAAMIFGSKVFVCGRRASHHKTSFKTGVVSGRAASWMLKVRPLMGSRRKEQIDAALSCYVPCKPRLTESEKSRIATRKLQGEGATTLAREHGISREYVCYLARNYGEYRHLVMASDCDSAKAGSIPVTHPSGGRRSG